MRDPNHPDPNNPLFQKEAGQILCRGVFGELRNRLRAVWLAEYDDVAEWRICMLQLLVHERTDFEDKRSRDVHPPSPDTPIELAIDWVRRHLLLLRVCRNPDCPRPFFIASAAQQRLCSDACIAVAQKAHKRKWWNKQNNDENHLGGEEIHKSPVSPMAIADAAAEQLTEPRVNKKPGAKISKAKSRVAGGESESTLKRFLQNIVNAPDNRVDNLLSTYARFFPSMTRAERLVARNAISGPFSTPDSLKISIQKEKREAFERLRGGLQSIWNSDDSDKARWRFFTLQAELHRSTDPDMCGSGEELKPPPADRPIHQALALLGRNLHVLKACNNAACHVFPLFIANKGSQRYCSDPCSSAAQQEFKTRWWEEKGSDWRKLRRAKQKKSRKTAHKGH